MLCEHDHTSASLDLPSFKPIGFCVKCDTPVEMECIIPFEGRPFFIPKLPIIGERTEAHPANNPDLYVEMFEGVWVHRCLPFRKL